MNNNHSKLNNYLSLNALLQKQAAYYVGPNSKYVPKLPKGALQIGLTNPALPAVKMPNPPHIQTPISEQYKGITNPSLSFPYPRHQ